jgi:hypothetical protein
MANTLGEVITEVYYLMNEKTTSSTYDKTNYVIPRINTTIDAIVKGKIRSLVDGRLFTSTDMRFLRQELYFENVPKISLTTAVAM